MSADGKKEGKKIWPDLRQKAPKQLKKPPPKLVKTKGNTGNDGKPQDLRARALGMHQQMQELWNPKKATNVAPVTRITKEEYFGVASCYALEILNSASPSNVTAGDVRLISQIINEISSSLEWKTEATKDDETPIQTTDIARMKKKIQSELLTRSSRASSSGSSSQLFRWRYQIVANTDKGIRTENEDTYIVVDYFNELLGLQDSPPQVYLGLFDGHKGKQAAEFCRTQLHVNIGLNKDFGGDDPSLALINGFLATDKQFNERAEDNGADPGTTAMAVLIREDTIIVANCGDAKGFLCRSNSEEYIPLCTTQRPNREDEQERIKKAGGKVVWFGTWRVNGVLGVSRSIGDKTLKQIVIAEPEVQITRLQYGQDEFVVLATDGLWDVWSEAEVITFIRENLKTKSRQEVCDALIDEAVNKRNSKDNVSVIIVFFDYVDDCPAASQ